MYVEEVECGAGGSAENTNPRGAAPAASPAHSVPKKSITAATVRRVAAARAAAALRAAPLDVPSSRALSTCRRARRDTTV
eukprot:5416345-Prymnesium_polylepis.1